MLEEVKEANELASNGQKVTPFDDDIDIGLEPSLTASDDDTEQVENGINNEEDDNNDEEDEKKEGEAKKDISDYGALGQMRPEEHLRFTIQRSYQMHQLSGVHFAYRHFWCLFLPAMFLTMVAGVLAFTCDSTLPLSDRTKSLFSFIVGTISVVNVFIQNLNNELNFGHRAKTHQAMALGLKGMLTKMSSLKARKLEQTVNDEKTQNFEKQYETLEKHNDSNFPAPIVLAYALAMRRLDLQLFPPVKFDRSKKSAYNKVRYMQVMEIVHTELFSEFTKHRHWPLFLPNPECTVQNAIEKVRFVLEHEAQLAEEGENVFQSMLRASRNGMHSRKEQKHESLYKLLLRQQRQIRKANIKDKSEAERETYCETTALLA